MGTFVEVLNRHIPALRKSVSVCPCQDKTLTGHTNLMKQSLFSFDAKERVNHTLSITRIIHIAGVSCLSLSLGQRIKTSTVDEAQYREA